MKDNQGNKTACLLRRLLLPVFIGVAVWYPSQTALSQGTPWIAEPRTGSISVSYYQQKATEFYRGTETVKGPLEATGATLSQYTVWFHANYALNDAIAVDLQTAWAKSFVNGAVGPSGGQESYNGLYDTNLSVTWRFLDELVSNTPSVAARIGVTIPGGYDTGYINSLGDGGSGIEGSLIVGKFWNVAGASAEIGYRHRGSTMVNPDAVGAAQGEDVDIPSEIFMNFWLFVPIRNRVRVGANYRMVNATSGLDIGGAGFSPSRFPGLEEDSQLLGLQLFVPDLFGSVSVHIFDGWIVGGRNTAKSNVIGAGLTVGLGGGFGSGL
ncbi:MAG: hypothetical protein F4246_08830 [Rhodothermaceae bacterium]|nr:hypothetical protein [Rhodothermaceae bacterium]MXX58739.1 hypothetical protein [Rhodothermaceae bacterium]MYD18147.1 hypothetical protein [Rhodothermaceae bacterium]MYD57106.1 hypothetical protein [Rhodothermaceae bacterium]MYI44662.1 hypothetical protein [Rhodothermaceae bacterium]